MTFSSGITDSGRDICKILLSAEEPFFDFLSESSYLKNRCRTFIFMGHDDVFTACHPHQDACEFSIIDIKARHVDEGMPFAVAPGRRRIDERRVERSCLRAPGSGSGPERKSVLRLSRADL